MPYINIHHLIINHSEIPHGILPRFVRPPGVVYTPLVPPLSLVEVPEACTEHQVGSTPISGAYLHPSGGTT
jgi:hypothetical protein